MQTHVWILLDAHISLFLGNSAPLLQKEFGANLLYVGHDHTQKNKENLFFYLFIYL